METTAAATGTAGSCRHFNRTKAGWLLQLCAKLTKTIHKTGYKQEIETEMSLFWKHSLWSSMSTSTTMYCLFTLSHDKNWQQFGGKWYLSSFGLS